MFTVPLVENRDESGSLFRGDPIKIKNQGFVPLISSSEF
jgi:hypothetical protein